MVSEQERLTSLEARVGNLIGSRADLLRSTLSTETKLTKLEEQMSTLQSSLYNFIQMLTVVTGNVTGQGSNPPVPLLTIPQQPMKTQQQEPEHEPAQDLEKWVHPVVGLKSIESVPCGYAVPAIPNGKSGLDNKIAPASVAFSKVISHSHDHKRLSSSRSRYPKKLLGRCYHKVRKKELNISVSLGLEASATSKKFLGMNMIGMKRRFACQKKATRQGLVQAFKSLGMSFGYSLIPGSRNRRKCGRIRRRRESIVDSCVNRGSHLSGYGFQSQVLRETLTSEKHKEMELERECLEVSHLRYLIVNSLYFDKEWGFISRISSDDDELYKRDGDTLFVLILPKAKLHSLAALHGCSKSEKAFLEGTESEYGLSEKQAEAIVEISLLRPTVLEWEKFAAERSSLTEQIKRLDQLLSLNDDDDSQNFITLGFCGNEFPVATSQFAGQFKELLLARFLMGETHSVRLYRLDRIWEPGGSVIVRIWKWPEKYHHQDECIDLNMGKEMKKESPSLDKAEECSNDIKEQWLKMILSEYKMWIRLAINKRLKVLEWGKIQGMAETKCLVAGVDSMVLGEKQHVRAQLILLDRDDILLYLKDNSPNLHKLGVGQSEKNSLALYLRWYAREQRQVKLRKRSGQIRTIANGGQRITLQVQDVQSAGSQQISEATFFKLSGEETSCHGGHFSSVLSSCDDNSTLRTRCFLREEYQACIMAMTKVWEWFFDEEGIRSDSVVRKGQYEEERDTVTKLVFYKTETLIDKEQIIGIILSLGTDSMTAILDIKSGSLGKMVKYGDEWIRKDRLKWVKVQAGYKQLCGLRVQLAQFDGKDRKYKQVSVSDNGVKRATSSPTETSQKAGFQGYNGVYGFTLKDTRVKNVEEEVSDHDNGVFQSWCHRNFLDILCREAPYAVFLLNNIQTHHDIEEPEFHANAANIITLVRVAILYSVSLKRVIFIHGEYHSPRPPETWFNIGHFAGNVNTSLKPGIQCSTSSTLRTRLLEGGEY